MQTGLFLHFHRAHLCVCVAGARSILHMTSGSIVAKIYDANIVVTDEFRSEAIFSPALQDPGKSTRFLVQTRTKFFQ